MTKSYDYIIIGSGFGGSVTALRLAEKGYSFLVVEKGRRYRTEDFPNTNWNLKKYLWRSQIPPTSSHRIVTLLAPQPMSTSEEPTQSEAKKEYSERGSRGLERKILEQLYNLIYEFKRHP